MSKSVTVYILNWEKYKGRKDVERPTWFKCANDILEDEKMQILSLEEICVWVHILSQNSRQSGKGEVFLSYESAQRRARLSEEVISSALQKLCDLKIISTKKPKSKTPKSRDVNGTPTSRSRDAREEKKREDKRREEESHSTEQNVNESGPISQFSFSRVLKPYLNAVPYSIQFLWIEKYEDVQWIKSKLEDCVLKSTSKQNQILDWGVYFTNWLSREKDKPKKKVDRVNREAIAEASLPRDYKAHDDLLDKMGVSSVVDLIGKI